MVSMTGIFHSANDRRALDRLYCYTLRVGFILSAITAGIVFIGAPLITNVYTRGIQLDIYTFLLCIPLGLGKSMVSMTGIFHSANDSSSWTSVRFQGSSGIDRFQPHSSVAFHIYNKLHTLQGDSETT